ncbi:MAG: hypothetical protein K0R28_577, partial [Paenibacillus sp.]|nr:hypothetical protein [Paenibacillus sp.]
MSIRFLERVRTKAKLDFVSIQQSKLIILFYG